jgi:two-component system CheB/CheR fusion protein
MPESHPKAAPAEDADLERIIEKISTEHGFDVRGYKRTTLYRRIRKRLADAGCTGADEYLVRLESDPQEHAQLVDTILINVTEFFRDPEAWEYFQRECLASLLRRRAEGEPMRAWSVGCATGEEPYTLAICMAELMGERSLRNLKIYATDLDEGALAVARAGIYSPEQLKNVSPERLEKHFEAISPDQYKLRRELRSAVIYGRHNILADPPISRLDVLVCRNLLIYFDTDTQQQLITRFHYALRDESCLFLGKAETLMTRSLLFRPAEARYRIFQRVPQQAMGENMAAPANHRRRPGDGRNGGPVEPALEGQNYALHAVINQSGDPVLLLDPAGRLVMASETAHQVFRIAEAQMGHGFPHPDDRARLMPLRLAIEDVRAAGRPAQVDELPLVARDGKTVHLAVEVRPILDPQGNLLHIILWGRDLTREWELNEELLHLRQELETTNGELQTTNEELETTNEELQSTNEELETTNEELQSTNEELETTIEELQSTNEELETANDELRARQDEMADLSRYQELILSNLRMGLMVLNRNLQVTSWNLLCRETWGLREDEVVNHDLFSLDIGLPLARLREPLLRVLHGETPHETLELEATNRRGRPIHCRTQLQPLRDSERAIDGAMIVIDGIVDGA